MDVREVLLNSSVKWSEKALALFPDDDAFQNATARWSAIQKPPTVAYLKVETVEDVQVAVCPRSMVSWFRLIHYRSK